MVPKHLVIEFASVPDQQVESHRNYGDHRVQVSEDNFCWYVCHIQNRQTLQRLTGYIFCFWITSCKECNEHNIQDGDKAEELGAKLQENHVERNVGAAYLL